jgi:hypothetical protein
METPVQTLNPLRRVKVKIQRYWGFLFILVLFANAEKTFNVPHPLRTKCLCHECRQKSKRILARQFRVSLDFLSESVQHFFSQLQGNHCAGKCHFMGIVDLTHHQLLAVWLAANNALRPPMLAHSCYEASCALQVLSETVGQLLCTIMKNRLRE